MKYADKSMGRYSTAAAAAVMALACLACADASTRHLLQSGESKQSCVILRIRVERVRSRGNLESSISSFNSVRPVVGPLEFRTGQCNLSASEPFCC